MLFSYLFGCGLWRQHIRNRAIGTPTAIDVQLIAGGHARAWTQDGQHRDLLVGLERSARENEDGCLWR